MNAIFILMLVSVPALLIMAAQRYVWLDKIGLVVLAFGFGILLPVVFDLKAIFSGVELLAVQTQVTELAIVLAIPMLSFSMDLGSAFRLAGSTIKAMCLAVLSVLFITTILSLLFDGEITNLWQVAALSIGAYTGGGPNMAAISAAMKVDQTLFVTMTSYDMLLSALYLLFVISIAKPIFGLLLKPFQASIGSEDKTSEFSHLSDESAQAFKQLVVKGSAFNLLEIAFYALLSLGLGLGIAQLFPQSISSIVTIVAITSVGAALPFVPRVKQLKQSFHCGMYLVLVFCFTMGSMTDLAILRALDLSLFCFIALLLAGTVLLHALLCKAFGIDTDTFLITSSAAIMSVPFIPVIAGALKNKALIVPGFAAAILGYILGNYLGIMMAFFIRWLLAT